VTLSITIGKATDPTFDPNWSNSGTFVGWNILTDGATTPPFVLVAVGNPSFSAVIVDASAFQVVCDSSQATATFDLPSNAYTVSFPATCVQNPSSIAVQGAYFYNTSATSPTGASYFSPEWMSCCTTTPDYD
jgi:hypothetical protein